MFEQAERETAPAPIRRPLTRVQRQLLAFSAVFLAWLAISILLIAVGIAGGGEAAQYALGALVVLLIPVMLVMLFILLRHALADERRRTPSEPVVTPGDVRAAVTRGFPDDDPAAILAALDAATARVPLLDRAAVQRALVLLSEGNPALLRYLAAQVEQDYRDLLIWADDMMTPREDGLPRR